MTPIRITKDNFYEQMLRYGFLYDQIPSCFCSDDFADHADELLNGLKIRSVRTTPFSMPIRKNAYSRRTVSIPNPESFAVAVKYLANNWSDVKNLAYSGNSQSPITFFASYDNPFLERINNENAREAVHARSDFVKNVLMRNRLSLGLTIKLSMDLRTFYDSIYTHSLAWALCGKTEAKRYFSSKQDPKPAYYDFANNLDKYTRNMKGQETNGILTGPYTSRIYSELLLANIDKLLRDQGLIFRRYVDDYSFYCETELKAKEAIIKFEDITREFGLQVNHEKTKIEPFPFDTLSAMKARLDRALKTGGAFELLNEASILHLEGEKGAYKYALKMLANKKDLYCDSATISLLFNIGISDPRQCRFVTSYLKRHSSHFDHKRLSSAINQLLSRALEARREDEILSLLSISKELKMPLLGEVVEKAIAYGNDLARIIALDYWVNANGFVVRTRNEAQRINSAVAKLQQSLQGESFDGEHWLLLFEAENKGLVKTKRTSGKTDNFIQSMQSKQISFYSGLEQNDQIKVSTSLGDFFGN